LSGICRFNIVEEIEADTPYRQCLIKKFEQDLDDTSRECEVNREAVLVAFKNYLKANNMEADWDTIAQTDDLTLINALCMMSPYSAAEKQALLEAADLKTRAETLIAISEFNLAHHPDEKSQKLQ